MARLSRHWRVLVFVVLWDAHNAAKVVGAPDGVKSVIDALWFSFGVFVTIELVFLIRGRRRG